MVLADSTLVLPQNTTDFSYFAAPTGATPITVAAASLTNNTRNFLELQLTTVDGTPLSKVFWDSTVNSGAGAEFSQVVNTVTDLAVTVSVLTTAFSGSVDALPLAILDVDNGGLITSIFDRRDLFGRLAKPGNLANEFSWGTKVDPVFSLTLTGVTGTFVAGEALTIGGETATVVAGGTTSITFNKVSGVNFFPVTSTATGAPSGATGTVATFTEAFVGVDKNIHTVEDAIKALMTEMKKIKGTSAWYEDAPGNLSTVGIPFGVGTNTGANVQVATFAPPFTALTKGMQVSYSPDISITGTATLNIDGLGAKNIVKYIGGAPINLVLGDIVAGLIHDMLYSGTEWILRSPATALTSSSPAAISSAWTFNTNPILNAGVITTSEIANGTVVDANINPAAAIADTKLSTIATANKVSDTALNIPNVKFMSTYADFATAVSTIGATATTLIVSELEVVAANVTVPPTLTLKPVGQGELSVNATFTVTINGPLDATLKKVFSGAGTINFGALVLEVYPEWWGAVSDAGITDSTLALQAALDTRKTVKISAVNNTSTDYFKLTAQLNGNSDQKVVGEGYASILRQTANNLNVLIFTSKTHFTVRGVHCWNNATTSSLTNGNGIFLDFCTRSVVSNNFFTNIGMHGVFLKDSNDNVVSENHILGVSIINSSTADIALKYACSRNVVKGNHCLGGGRTGIAVQSILVGDNVNDNIITDNIITAHGTYGIMVYRLNLGDFVFRTIVTNNNIKGITGGDTIPGFSKPFGAGIYIQGAEYSNVSRNTIDDTNSLTDEDLLAPGAIGVTNVSSVTVQGNIIRDPQWYGITVRDPNNQGNGTGYAIVNGNNIIGSIKQSIHVQQRDRVQITNNTVSIPTLHGIHIANTTAHNDFLVSGNQVTGATQGFNAAFTDNIIVSNNIIRSSSLQNFIFRDGNRVLIDGNISIGASSDGINVATVTDGILSNNLVTGNSTGMSISNVMMIRDNKVYGNTVEWVGTGQIITSFTSADATPSVKDGEFFKTAGTTAITDFDDGEVGQTIRIIATASITITEGTPIRLSGVGNFAMTIGDTLILTMYNDQVWVEDSRMVD